MQKFVCADIYGISGIAFRPQVLDAEHPGTYDTPFSGYDARFVPKFAFTLE
jgi:hypothetical protein